jgi:hypothetical protein
MSKVKATMDAPLVKFICKGRVHWVPRHIVEACDCPADVMDYLEECDDQPQEQDQDDGGELADMDKATRDYENSRW